MDYVESSPGDTAESIARRFAAREGREVDTTTFRIKRRGRRVDAAFRLVNGFLWHHIWRETSARTWKIETVGRIPYEVESLYTVDEIFSR